MLRNCPDFKVLRMFPSVLAWYLPSYPGISFHLSIKVVPPLCRLFLSRHACTHLDAFQECIHQCLLCDIYRLQKRCQFFGFGFVFHVSRRSLLTVSAILLSIGMMYMLYTVYTFPVVHLMFHLRIPCRFHRCLFLHFQSFAVCCMSGSASLSCTLYR